MNQSIKPMPKLMYLVIFGFFLAALVYMFRLVLGYWEEDASQYWRNSREAYLRWAYYSQLSFWFDFYFEKTEFYCKTVGYIALAYVLYFYRKWLYEPLEAFVPNHPNGFFRLAMAVYLLYPAQLIRDYYWGSYHSEWGGPKSDLQVYSNLIQALYYFGLCLAYLLLEEAYIRLKARVQRWGQSPLARAS